MKTCPMCAEQVQDAAVVCRYCQHKFSSPRRSPPPASKNAKIGYAVGGMLGVVFLIVFVIAMGRNPPAPERAIEPIPATLSAAERAECGAALKEAERLGLIKARPSPTRVDVDETLWAQLPADTKRGLLAKLSCDGLGKVQLVDLEGPVVAYGYRSGKRLAMLTSVGVNFE